MRFLNYLLYSGGWFFIVAILGCLKYILLDKLNSNQLKYVLGMTVAYAFTLFAAYVYLKNEGIDLRLGVVTGMRPMVTGALVVIPVSYCWLLLHYKKPEEKVVPLSRKLFLAARMYLNAILILCGMFVLRVFIFGSSLNEELRILHIETDSLIGWLTISGILITASLGLAAVLAVVWYAHKKGWKGMFDANFPPSRNHSKEDCHRNHK